MTLKWKGFKVEWRDQECRFVNTNVKLFDSYVYSPWFKPLRFSDGNLSRPDFLKAARIFNGTYMPKGMLLGSRTPNVMVYTTLKPTTGGVIIKHEP